MSDRYVFEDEAQPAPSAGGRYVFEDEPKAEQPTSFLNYLKQRTRPTSPSKTAFGNAWDQTVGRASRAFTEFGKDLIGGSEESPLPGGSVVPEGVSRTMAAAANPIPETPVQAGAMAATGGAGKLVGLAAKTRLPVATLQAYPWLARVLGGAAGGELGGELSGETPGVGAAKGGGAALVGEAATGGAQALRNKTYPWTEAGRKAIASGDLARVGKTMGEVAPTLQPGTTSNAVQRTAEGQGLARIGAGKEDAIQQIERVIGGQPIRVPTVSNTPISLRAANAELSEVGQAMDGFKPLNPRYGDVEPKQLYGQISNEIREGIRRGELEFQAGLGGARKDWMAQAQRKALPAAAGPSMQPSSPTSYGARPLTQRESVERTLEAAAPVQPEAAWRPPLTPTRSLNDAEALTARQLEGGPYREMGANAIRPERLIPSGRMAMVEATPTERQLRFNIRRPESIQQGQTSLGAGLWDMAQSEYRAGRSGVLPLLERTQLFKQNEFNISDLQNWLRTPKNRAELANALGGSLKTGENLGDYNKLVNSITGGAGAGFVDRPAGKMPKLLEGGSYAGGRYPAAVARFFYPNYGANYIGTGRIPQAPAPSANIRSLVDAALQKATP